MVQSELRTVAFVPGASGDLAVADPSRVEGERAIAENVLTSKERVSYLNLTKEERLDYLMNQWDGALKKMADN